jgi:hypothetical protein
MGEGERKSFLTGWSSQQTREVQSADGRFRPLLCDPWRCAQWCTCMHPARMPPLLAHPCIVACPAVPAPLCFFLCFCCSVLLPCAACPPRCVLGALSWRRHPPSFGHGFSRSPWPGVRLRAGAGRGPATQPPHSYAPPFVCAKWRRASARTAAAGRIFLRGAVCPVLRFPATGRLPLGGTRHSTDRQQKPRGEQAQRQSNTGVLDSAPLPQIRHSHPLERPTNPRRISFELSCLPLSF